MADHFDDFMRFSDGGIALRAVRCAVSVLFYKVIASGLPALAKRREHLGFQTNEGGFTFPPIVMRMRWMGYPRICDV